MPGRAEVLKFFPHEGRDDFEDILFICTANICRSPIAAELLKSRLGELPTARIRSAGFLEGSRPPTKQVIRVTRKRGLDLKGHLSSPVSTSLEISPDLVLVMTGQHLRSLVDFDPRLFSRAFTLKEFVRLAEFEGPRFAGEEISQYVYRVGGRRGPSALVPGTAEDIFDPVGGRRSDYERCAREIEDLVSSLALHLYPHQGASGRKQRS